MSKLKSPFLSLGARGTIGNTLTVQERGGASFIRTKPIPAYRYTLPQAYQRWLYEDYAYLWRQQSEATRREYATKGTRFHLTGFQYWMKYNLTNMPDIVGWWKLDEGSGAVAYDSSPRHHNATIFGATPTTGVITGARFYDGINDYVTVPAPPPVDFTEMTFLCFTNIPSFDGALRVPLEWGLFAAPWGIMLMSHATSNIVAAYMQNTAGAVNQAWIAYTPDVWELHGGVWDGTTLWQVRNESLLSPVALGGVVAPIYPIYFGRKGTPADTRWLDGYMDNIIIFNRALDATEIARWAGRRYPP